MVLCIVAPSINDITNVIQTVYYIVAEPANNCCTLVIMYVLFGPGRVFGVGCCSLIMHL
jgi:hypothetical protein